MNESDRDLNPEPPLMVEESRQLAIGYPDDHQPYTSPRTPSVSPGLEIHLLIESYKQRTYVRNGQFLMALYMSLLAL